MVSITFQDILNQISDMNQNYTTSTVDLGNIQRAANRAIEFVQRRLGLPSDRRIFTFNFFQDTKFYTLPDGFGDAIQLYYNTQRASVDGDKNIPENRWNAVEDTEILRSTGQYRRQNRFAFTTINRSNQIMLDGQNTKPTILINSFDGTDGMTFSTSLINRTTDTTVKKQGTGSLRFDLNSSEVTSTVTLTGVNYDIRSLINDSGAYRAYVFFSSGSGSGLESVNIRLISSVGNYYQVSVTTDYLGAVFASNDWSLLSFPLSSATIVGTPNAAAITSIAINFVHTPSFTSRTGMRLDNLYTITPDVLDLVYYSIFKGTNNSGSTEKILLNDGNDLLSFGSFAPDLILPIALKAATILWPQLRADPTFMASYKQDFTETLLLYGKSYPRKRLGTASSTQLNR